MQKKFQTYRKALGFLLLGAVGLISGCAGSNGQLASTQSSPTTIHYEFTGIPPLYFGYGSSVPLTKELSLTAAHVAKLNFANVVAYHPTCDLAIIESDNSQAVLPTLGFVRQGESVFTYGMDGFGEMLTGKGTYHLDLTFANRQYLEDCPGSVMDAPIRGGMSGGATYNAQGELVGVITAMASKWDTRLANGKELPYDRLSLFVSMNYVQDWLNSEVQNYYFDTAYALNWSLDSTQLVNAE